MSSPIWHRRRRGVRARIARRHAARIEALFAPHLTSADAFALWEGPLAAKLAATAERYSHAWEHAYRQRWIVGMDLPADVDWPDQRTPIWTLPRDGASLEFVVLDETHAWREAVQQQLAEIAVRSWPAASEDEPSGQ